LERIVCSEKYWSAIELELDRNGNGIGSVIDYIRIGSGPDRNRKKNVNFIIFSTVAPSGLHVRVL
jgi:hypothetical protein